MRRNSKLDKDVKKNINAIENNGKRIIEKIEQTNERLDNIKSDTTAIKKSSTSKVPLIISIISLVFTISGISIYGLAKEWKEEGKTAIDSKPEDGYEIYLYPEYSTFAITTEVNMIASLNFETEAVNITAYLASGGQDTVALGRKNATEWQKKVQFTETGIHKIVVTAIAPNGEAIQNSIEVEVTPIPIDTDLFNQFLNP